MSNAFGFLQSFVIRSAETRESISKDYVLLGHLRNEVSAPIEAQRKKHETAQHCVVVAFIGRRVASLGSLKEVARSFDHMAEFTTAASHSLEQSQRPKRICVPIREP